MTIVTYRPKRPAKPAQAATIKVTHDRAAHAQGQGLEAAAGRSGSEGAGGRVPTAGDPAAVVLSLHHFDEGQRRQATDRTNRAICAPRSLYGFQGQRIA